MPRRFKAGVIPPPSYLARVLQNLNKQPKPIMPTLTALRLTMAKRNDHFGTRHFVKEDLPRIQYANPKLNIEVTKKLQTSKENFAPKMELRFAGGATQTIDLDGKWSTNIFEDLMDLAGGSAWEKWKETHPSERREVESIDRTPARTPKAKIEAAKLPHLEDTEPEPVMRTKAQRRGKPVAPIPDATPVDTSGWKSVSAALP